MTLHSLLLLLALVGGLPTAASAVTVAFYGDSLTAGGGYFGGLPSEWTLLDFGEPGDECYNDVAARLMAALDTPGHPVLESDVIVIFCGTNDAIQPVFTLEQSGGAIWMGVDAALAAGLPVVLVAPPPIFNKSGDPIAVFNARLEELRDALELHALMNLMVGFANVYDAFWEAWNAGSTLDDLYVGTRAGPTHPDYVHPYAYGRTLEAVTIEPAITTLLQPLANQPPVAIVTAGATSGLAPLTVNLDGSGSVDPEGGPLLYDWSSGNGDSSSESSATFVYPLPGTFSARLTVVDDQSLSYEVEIPITVNAPPAPAVPAVTGWARVALPALLAAAGLIFGVLRSEHRSA
jgi:lysophospholipase L1-like esterase